jgi:acetyl esterase/lipase
MRTFSRRFLLASALPMGLGGCSAALGTFNAVVPIDAGAQRVAVDVAYGPEARQQLDLYAPASATALPTILFIYGGSWNSGSRSEYAFVGQALASRGFLVAVIDYRLVPQVRYPAFLDDGAMALKWLHERALRYGGDPNQLYVVGHSAGAYNALMLALDPSLAARAGLRGQVLKGAVGLAGPYDFLPLDIDVTKEAFGRWPRVAETQPINHISRYSPPIFLATGDEDDIVYPRNTATMAGKLSAAGRPVEERVYRGIGHVAILAAFSLPFRTKAPVLEDVTTFIRAHRHDR